MAFVTFDATAQDGPQGAYTAAPGGDFPVTVGSGAQRGAIALVTVRRVDAYSVSSNASLVYCRLGGVEMTLLGRIWLNNDTGSSSGFIAVYALGGQYGAMPAAGSQTLSYQQYLTGVTFCQYNAAVITLSNVDSFGTPQTTAGTETGTTFSTVAINSAAEDVIVAALSHQSTADLTSSTTGWVERQDLEQQSYAQRTIFGTNTATGSISVTASRASGVDYCTLAVNVVGPPPRNGSASGDYSWSANVNGKETPKGAVAGAYTWSATATGKEYAKGQAVFAYNFAGGSVTGKETPKGSATLPYRFPISSATGKRTPKGGATFGYGWGATATGKRTPRGNAGTGNYTWSASAAGKETPKGSVASAPYRFPISAASGKRTPKGDGGTRAWTYASAGVVGINPANKGQVINAAYGYGGASSGKRVPKGQTTLGYGWGATATGKEQPKGSGGTRNYQWSATATGKETPKGAAATGNYTWSGAATGKKIMRGQAQAGFIDYATDKWLQNSPLRIVGTDGVNQNIELTTEVDGLPAIKMTGLNPATYPGMFISRPPALTYRTVTPGQQIIIRAKFRHPASNVGPEERSFIQARMSSTTDPTTYPPSYPGTGVYQPPDDVWETREMVYTVPPGYDRSNPQLYLRVGNAVGNVVYARDIEWLIENIGIGKFGWSGAASGKRTARGSSYLGYAFGGPQSADLTNETSFENAAQWTAGRSGLFNRVTGQVARTGSASMRADINLAGESWFYIPRHASSGAQISLPAKQGDWFLYEAWVYTAPDTPSAGNFSIQTQCNDSGGTRLGNSTSSPNVLISSLIPGHWTRFVYVAQISTANTATINPYFSVRNNDAPLWVEDTRVTQISSPAYGVEQPKGQAGRQLTIDGVWEAGAGVGTSENASMVRTALAARSGGFGIRLTPATGVDANLTPFMTGHTASTIPVTPGDKFDVEFWYRAPSSNTAPISATPRVAIRDATTLTYNYPSLPAGQILNLASNSDWLRYRTTYTVPANVDRLRFTVQLGQTFAGQVLDVDDFIVVAYQSFGYNFAGTAVGKETPKGNGGTRGYSWSGGAFGRENPKGNVANGPYRFPFSLGTGKRTPKGGATFGYRFPGAATGKETPKGTATLPYRFARLSVTGKRRPKGYVSEGTYAWDGVVFGQQVLPKMPEFAPANPPSLKLISERQHVVLHTYDGIQVAQFTTERQLSMKWSRALRETTTLDLTVPPRAGYTNISDISPWLHWASVWDDTGRELYWTGPVQRVAQTSRSLQLRAADVSVYFRRTRCPVTNRWTARNPAIIADELWRLMIDSKGFNIKPRVLRDPRGTMFDFEAVQDQEMLDQTMRKLTDLGLYWSVVAGTPVLGPAPLEPIVSLGEEHFASDQIAAVRDGTNTFNDVVLRGANTVARARKPLGGLQLETIVSMDDVFGVGNADRAVQEFVRHTGGIRDSIEMPSGAVFAPGVPLTIQDLVPSIRMTVTAYEMRRLVELETVNVTVAPSQIPQVAVDLESVDDEPPELMAAAVR